MSRASNRLGSSGRDVTSNGPGIASSSRSSATSSRSPGIQTQASPSVALLAWRYQADVIVAGIRRVDDAFRFELVIEDDAPHAEWASQDDPVTYLTGRYLRALERMVLVDPTQYLWGYARWGKAFAREITAHAASTTPV